MTFTRLEFRNGWSVPVNEQGEVDWKCPKCGHVHTSCCGNSHFPCTDSAQYGGQCKCDYLDSLGSMDNIWKHCWMENLNQYHHVSYGETNIMELIEHGENQDNDKHR